MTVDELSASRRRSIRSGAPISRAAISRSSSCAPMRRVNDLSRGMRTKLALLLALSTGAELLILDEPTSGLDPAATEQVLQDPREAGGPRRNDGAVLVAPARRRRADRRPHRDRRPRPRRRRRRARRRARALPAHPARVRRRRAGRHVQVARRRRHAPRGPSAVACSVERGRGRRRRRSARAEPEGPSTCCP